MGSYRDFSVSDQSQEVSDGKNAEEDARDA
jgi:hypothetical protein